MHDAATAEKLQVKASSSLTNIATLPSSDMQEQKGKDLKNHTCDATYLIYSNEGYVSSRPLGLSNACDKQVSSASPFSSLNTRQDAMLSSEFLSVGSDTDKDLVQAVLCSRNKIALALAEITRKTWLRSSKLCSEEMACPVDGKIFASSKSVLNRQSFDIKHKSKYQAIKSRSDE